MESRGITLGETLQRPAVHDGGLDLVVVHLVKRSLGIGRCGDFLEEMLIVAFAFPVGEQPGGLVNAIGQRDRLALEIIDRLRRIRGGDDDKRLQRPK